MKTFLLIRHGRTQGNLEGRYIGRTDEPLCRQGVEELLRFTYPPVCGVFASPMRRCIQTARCLYPGNPLQIVDAFRECDFGAFENLNYAQLNGRADYQRWVDSGGRLPFPGGESRTAFAARCVRAFMQVSRALSEGTYAFIVHGGTIMAIMENLALPAGDYFAFRAANGQGYALNEDGSYKKFVPPPIHD